MTIEEKIKMKIPIAIKVACVLTNKKAFKIKEEIVETCLSDMPIKWWQ